MQQIHEGKSSPIFNSAKALKRACLYVVAEGHVYA